MVELISKWKVVDMLTALENEFQHYKPFEGFEHAMYRKVVEVEMEIGKMVAIEAEPVVHAHWEVVHGVLTPGGDPLLRCPRCRSRGSEHLGGIECNRPHWNYCPICGAHMDEEVANV